MIRPYTQPHRRREFDVDNGEATVDDLDGVVSVLGINEIELLALGQVWSVALRRVGSGG